MSSASYKIRRSDINNGGSDQGASASYKMTDSVGTIGGKLLSGTTFFVFSGFSNVVSHPDSIEDLSELPLSSTTLSVTWTAPTAFGSTGTATSYNVRYSTNPITTEVGFINAPIYSQSWVPHAPGILEIQTATGLSANTTYYFAVKGADVAGNTGYLSNNTSASTLTGLVSGITITNVYQSSVTLSWTGLGAPNAEGYRVEGSTNSSFATMVHSSSTTDGALTTLTVTGLRRGALNYFRVGGLNWSSQANFVIGPSTITLPGPAPTNPVISAVYASSITLSWGSVAADAGYVAQAAIDAGYTAVSRSSSTTNGAVTTLTISNLTANNTYYLRVGSLYDSATNFATVNPASTFTVAAVPTTGAISLVTPSTVSVTWSGSINASGTHFQSEISSISAVGAASTILNSSGTAATFTGLTQDTTYWVRVKALGWAGANSPYLIIGSSVTGTLTPLIIPTLDGFTMVGRSSATVSWQLTGGPTIVYDVDLAPADPFAAHQTVTVAGSSTTFTGLSVDSLYQVRVRGHSLTTGRVSTYSTSVSTYTQANPPLSLSTTSVTSSAVSLAWNGNSNPSNALYSIERSTDSVTFMQVGVMRALTYTDQGLTAGTAFAFRVRAINESGVPTDYSNTVLAMTTGVTAIPKRPTGIEVTRTETSTGHYQMTYQWHRVTERTDNTTMSNLSGYQIYTSPNLLTPRASWTLVTTVSGETWSTTAADATVNYYSIRAIDTSNVQSDWTQILDDTADKNHFFMGPDNVTRLQMPMVSAEVLRYEHNSYGADLWVDFTPMSSEETGRVVRSLKIYVSNVVTGNTLSDVAFSPALLHGTIGYSVQNGNVVSGAPEPTTLFSSAKIPVISASNAAQQLSLFWFNGVEWVKRSGQVNPADNTVSFTGSQIGSFQIRAATHGSGTSLTRVYPRIITPNGDGWNDKCIFLLDNPTQTPVSGKVYDITGALVANLKAGPNPDSSLAWDGKDSGGTVVPAGIYIYQIDLGGSAESGTVVVAR